MTTLALNLALFALSAVIVYLTGNQMNAYVFICAYWLVNVVKNLRTLLTEGKK